jgi:ubiquinone/menaquinone biosynthesis C-methylase UbiE
VPEGLEDLPGPARIPEREGLPSTTAAPATSWRRLPWIEGDDVVTLTTTRRRRSPRKRPPYTPTGIHLVGSLPLGSAEEAFRTVAGAVGDRVRRIPDGETGPRADWIVWQYPVLSARPEFEIGPPVMDFYRPLPRLKLRSPTEAANLAFGSLGYADAAAASYATFSVLKRDGVMPSACRFQVALPTPIAPISAFVALGDQAAVEVAYETALLAELQRILAAIPSDQLAIQWDTNFEFGMLEGVFPAWFGDVKSGILERLLRISRQVPAAVELGFHFCYGDRLQGFHRDLTNPGRLLEVANALAASFDRPLNWIHMPASPEAVDPDFYAPLADLRLRPETELYLGLIYPEEGAEGARARIEAAHTAVGEFGVATECGWGRRPAAAMAPLLDLHRSVSRAFTPAARAAAQAFHWPAGVSRLPDEEWVTQAPDAFGRQYDSVDNHGWYRNLDRTVAQLADELSPGDVLVDYSGGTGILLDRLRLRVFDRPLGMAIVDSSPKFLRVAIDRFRDDPRVAFRLLRYRKEEKRLDRLDEVLDPALLDRRIDAIVSTNAVHLYTDLAGTLASWGRVLRPGGKVFINSGNIRNPAARANEWILDETVYVVHEVASGLVRTDPRYSAYRGALDDPDRIRRHLAFRDRVFVPPRALAFYEQELRAAGFEVVDVSNATIVADVDDWFEFLKAYHEAVLGWVGGSAKVEGAPPSGQAVADRLALIRHAMEVIFGGRQTFLCCWTYLRAVRP